MNTDQIRLKLAEILGFEPRGGGIEGVYYINDVDERWPDEYLYEQLPSVEEMLTIINTEFGKFSAREAEPHKESTDEERLKQREAFLADLTTLSQHYRIIINGCGCCGSPFLVDETDMRKSHSEYYAELLANFGRCKYVYEKPGASSELTFSTPD